MMNPSARVPKGKKKRGKNKRKSKQQAQRLGADSLVFRPRAFGLPIPRILETEFWCEAEYKIPIASPALTIGNVKLNSCWLPFRPGGSTAFPSYTFLGPATESTLLPTGWSTLTTGQIYGAIKVIDSTIMVRWQGSNSGNNIMLVVVPTLNVTSIADIYQARTMPFMSEATFSVSRPNTGTTRNGWHVHHMNVGRLYGLTPIEEKAESTFLVGGPVSDPNVMFWWRLFMQSNDEDVTSTTASTFQVRIHNRVQMFSNLQMPNT